MNYYTSKDIAARYAVGRPNYHQIAIDKIKAYLQPNRKFPNVLDIGCGNGFSTIPLLELGEQVVGVDASAAMIAQAPKLNNTKFYVCAAEDVGSIQEEFELVTVSNAFHFFDFDSFFQGVQNLVVPVGWLIIYNNFFKGKLEENSAFNDWFTNIYLQKHPLPPRNRFDWDGAYLQKYGLKIECFEEFENTIPMNQQQLIDFFITQSNITVALERVPLADIVCWLEKELHLFFPDPTNAQKAVFGNYIAYLQKFEQ